jgi:hypothetical protein
LLLRGAFFLLTARPEAIIKLLAYVFIPRKNRQTAAMGRTTWWVVGWIAAQGALAADGPRFDREIRPFLADKCWHCHGPDGSKREAGLRLDVADDLQADRDGRRIVVPGQPDQSELWRRISSKDPDVVMPPPSEPRQLTDREKELLRQWIEAGGKFETHWAWAKPKRPELPAVSQPSWCLTAVDRFVLARLDAERWRPSSPADRFTLLRRVSLDMLGLPPSVDEADDFLTDASPDAYERLLDRLFASPRYAERMTLMWLDVARYADSGGYQGDILRTMWPWRDWVLKAFNAKMPFDQFTVEQLAGDLLPAPTRDQRIATGFHRNHRINDEDGIILEEFRVEYVADRVETTATVWMGVTFGCVRCHDHKYDPFSQRDYYGLLAYFNSGADAGRGYGNAPPVLPVFDEAQQKRVDEIDAALRVPDDHPADALHADLQLERRRIENAAVKVMVMEDLPDPRPTHVLIRGAYDKPGEKVAHAVPASLGVSSEDLPANRLGLAKWLMHPDHPLTARVTANRLWQMAFGNGLVVTQEDFGTQGSPPSHQDLLDWLAVELIRSGWNLQHVQRRMLTSAAYRQESNVSSAAQERDPENRLLARGPRFRMQAELIRDQALAASGLLVEQLGGPSVKPYQPPGLWEELASADAKYPQDHGASLYRRSMYTFIRRTIPPPGMTVLDAPNREICTVRRPRTNTPTQALALMNDPIYVEASRQLAERVLRELPQGEDAARITRMVRLVLTRPPADEEVSLLTSSLRHYRQRYQAKPEDAAALLKTGESPVDPNLSAVDIASHAAVAGLLFNLDEALTKE